MKNNIENFLEEVEKASSSILEDFLKRKPTIEKDFFDNPVKVIRNFDYDLDEAILGLSLLAKKIYKTSNNDITLILAPSFLHFLRVKLEKEEGREGLEEKASYLIKKCINSSLSNRNVILENKEVQKTFKSTKEVIDTYVAWYEMKEEK